MSRQIDFSKPLSKADQAYADDRPWLRRDAEMAGLVDEDVPEDEELEEEDKSYEDMSVEELRAELKDRELAVSGPKEALIQRLTEDDANNDED